MVINYQNLIEIVTHTLLIHLISASEIYWSNLNIKSEIKLGRLVDSQLLTNFE